MSFVSHRTDIRLWTIFICFIVKAAIVLFVHFVQLPHKHSAHVCISSPYNFCWCSNRELAGKPKPNSWHQIILKTLSVILHQQGSECVIDREDKKKWVEEKKSHSNLIEPRLLLCVIFHIKLTVMLYAYVILFAEIPCCFNIHVFLFYIKLVNFYLFAENNEPKIAIQYGKIRHDTCVQ